MSTIKAYAVHTVKLKGADHPASTKEKITVFDVPDQETFDRLLKLGAIRKPTKEELALAKAAAEEADGTTVLKAAEEKAADAADAKAPASGAKGDPKGKPEGAKEDLGV